MRLLVKLATLAAGIVAAAPALAIIATLTRIFVKRMRYPMDIEWLEGIHLYQAFREAHGMAVYASPEDGYCPLFYPPLYFLVVGGLGRVVGLDYWVGRGVSIAGLAMVCGAASWSIARNEGRVGLRLLLILLVSGAIAATFPAAGGWYDMVRVDSFAIGLLACGGALVERNLRSWWSTIAAALALAGAVFAKQTNLPSVAWLVGFAIALDRKTGARLAATTMAIASAGLVALLVRTSGWFWTWIMLASSHEIHVEQIYVGIRLLLADAPYLFVLPVLVLLAVWKGRLRSASLLWLGVFVSAAPLALLSFAKAGGYVNDLIPLLVTAPTATTAVLLDLSSGLRGALRRISLAAIVTLGAWFLTNRQFPAERYLLSRAEWANARALNVFIKNLDGDVLIPSHPFLAVRNSKGGEQLGLIGYADVRKAGKPWLDVRRDLLRIGSPWLILSRPGMDDRVIEEMDGLYLFVGELPVTAASRAFVSAPRLLYRRVGADSSLQSK